jgi:CubicO group peptidase (beta-lactamase class C family)
MSQTSEVSSADDLARSLVKGGVAPHGAAACAVRRGNSFRVELGGDRDTFFDLASLTKPMTAMAVMRARLPLSQRLGDVLPELAESRSGSVTTELLLSHRAGLAAHVPLYAPLVANEPFDPRAALRLAADARRPECAGDPPPSGFPPLYSDMGYALAGAALARHAGAADAGQATVELVVAPLGACRAVGTARSLEKAGIDLEARAAPTEDVPWRGGVVCGVVHDENAWALTGRGGSGHAGLFGTIEGLMQVACATLDALENVGPLSDANIPELIRERPGGTLRMGFDGKSPSGSSAGAALGPRTFGHLGFTGTSLWIDPDANVAVALLTNRVHPSREATAIREVRPVTHDALFRRALEL